MVERELLGIRRYSAALSGIKDKRPNITAKDTLTGLMSQNFQALSQKQNRNKTETQNLTGIKLLASQSEEKRMY